MHGDESDPARFICGYILEDGVNTCGGRYSDQTRLNRHIKQCHQVIL